MTVIFAPEKFDPIMIEGRALLERHRVEVAHFQDLMTLNVDDDIYRLLEAKDKLLIIGARDDGKLVGYISIFINTHPHYKHLLFANEDVMFVVPEHRDSSTGILLLKHAEKAMRGRGCHFFTVRTKVDHDHSLIFKRLGFTPIDHVFIKRLDGK